ncbi:hypothetical protein [Tunturiibacter lichenicola]|jgi:hypothetical protein
MKKPSQHLIAEVPRSITKVGMTIGVDLGNVLELLLQAQRRLEK